MHKLTSEIKIQEREEMSGQMDEIVGENQVKIEYDPLLYPPVVWNPLKRTEAKVHLMVKQDTRDHSRGNQLKYIRKAYVQALQSCLSEQQFLQFLDKFRRYRRSTAIMFCILMHLLINSPHTIQPFIDILREKIEAYTKENILDESETHCLDKFINEFLFGVSENALNIFFQMFSTSSYNSSKAARLIKVLERTSLQDLESLDNQLESSASFSEESGSKQKQVQAQVKNSESVENVMDVQQKNGNKGKTSVSNEPFIIYKRDDPAHSKLYPTDTQFAINNWMLDLLPRQQQ